MDAKHEVGRMKSFYSITAVAAILASAVIGYTSYIQTVAAYKNLPVVPAGRIAEPKVVAAMAYHGDKFTTFSDDFGVLWFKRDGQTCRLFTEKFEAYWKRRK